LTGADTLVLRRLSHLDGDTLSSLVEYGRSALGDSALDEWLLPVVAACGWLYVGVAGDETVGSAEVIRCRGEKDLYLEGFYIRPAFQGQGLGGKLLALVMAELGREGHERITATLDPDNEAAARLYQAAGFKGSSLLRGHYGPGRDRLLVSASLGRRP